MAKTKTKTEGMTRDEFWAEVARIGWGTKTTDTRAIKIELMRKGPDHCEGMRKHFDAVDSELYQATDMGGCDSYDDCRRQIIGLGKEEFERVLSSSSPKAEAQRRYDEGDYTESFAYCIPYESDYEDLKPERFTKWAAGEVEELLETIDAVRSADSELGHKQLTLLEILRAIEAGDFDTALEREAEARHLVEAIKRDWRALIEGLGGRFSWNEWGTLNLFSDLRKRLEVLA